MTRRRSFKKSQVPTKQIRWTVPEQLALDMHIVAQVVGKNEGELATLACLRMLEQLVPAWNLKSMYTKIPDLASLKKPNRPLDIRQILAELDTLR